MDRNRENGEFNKMYLLSPDIFAKFLEIYEKIKKLDTFEKDIYNVLIDNNLSSLSKLRLYQDLFQNRISKNTAQKRVEQEKPKLGSQKQNVGQDFGRDALAFSSPLKNSSLISHRDERSRMYDSFNDATMNNSNESQYNEDELQNSDANSYATHNERNATVIDTTISSFIKKQEILEQMKLDAIEELEIMFYVNITMN